MTSNINKHNLYSQLLGIVFIFSILNNLPFIQRFSLLSVITIFFSIFILFTATYKRFNLININFKFLFPIIIVAYTWTVLFFSNDFSVSLSQNYSYTILPIFFLLSTLFEYNKYDLKVIDNFIIFGGVIFISYVFFDKSIAELLQTRFSITIDSDQNATSAILLLLIFVTLKKLRSSKQLSRFLYLFLISILFWLFLLTGSRGGLLGLIVMIFTISIQIFNFKKISNIILLFFLILVSYFIVPIILPESVYSRLFYSTSYIDSVVSSGNRIAIWTYTIEKLLFELPFFGYGTGVPSRLIGSNFGFVYRGLHNTYLTLFFELGYLGFILFGLFLFKFFERLVSLKNYIYLGLFLGLLVVIFFIDSYSRVFFWITLVYISLSIENIKKKNIQVIKHE